MRADRIDDLGLGDKVMFADPLGERACPVVVPDAARAVSGDTGDFWNARPFLAHVRDAARARRVAPTAVLGALLARVAAFEPPSTCVPPFVGSHAALSEYVALIAASGGGKSAPARVARDLLPDAPPGVVGPLPLGSGEGLADAYCETVTDPNDRKRTYKRQTRHGALFDLDEGRVLAEMASRRGSTIAGALCAAWTGGDLGQANATSATFRHVRASSYALGLVSLWQPSKVAGLLDEADAGLPGRFLFVPTTDPDAPDVRPPWPGPLDWTPAPVITSPNPLDYAPEIATEVDAETYARLRGERVVDVLDAHRTLHRLKLAGLFAVLDGRRCRVDVDDWRLAGELLRQSDGLRATVVESVRIERARVEQSRIDLHVRREGAADDDRERRARMSGSRSLARKVHLLGGTVTRRVLTLAVSGKHRRDASLDDMIDHAIGEGWIECDGDCDGEHYRPGRSQPA